MNYNLNDLLGREPIVLDNKSISGQIKGKTILVTGAAGSIGSEIVRQVVKFSPATIIMLDQAETPLYLLSLEIEGVKGDTAIYPVLCNIVSRQAVSYVFEKYSPHIVYHAAAYKHVPVLEENPVQAVEVNVVGTKNLADLSVEFKVDEFVLISTDKAVNPESIMGGSKLIAEKYIRALHEKIKHESNTRFITTRFGNVLGSNGSVVPVFAAQIEKGGPVTVTHPDIKRYFMTVEEACQLVLEAGAMGKGAEIYLFHMGRQIKILELAKKMIIQAGLKPGVDIEIKITGLRAGEKLHEELVNSSAQLLPTHNSAIVIAKDGLVEFDALLENIAGMMVGVQNYEPQTIVAEMRKNVPSLGGKNSEYEVFNNFKKDE
jgi:FlaA1/EpsC-like NDP-sugar epimerase